jgi:methionyl-tRNA synthetase
MAKKFFITTAIDYVNSMPHLGTAYEKIGADVLARFKRLLGYETFFLMGTDEHSLNVEKQARALTMSPAAYCDGMSRKFQDVWKLLGISYDDFIRTTDARHIAAAQAIFKRIYDNGDIYKSEYKGWYCVSCEAFMKDKDLADGLCPVHRRKPEWVTESNYFFALSKYAPKLLDYIEKNKDFIRPAIRKNEIVNVIKGGLEDISVSRSSVGWGIPVPIDEKQVIYVWFDALINYVTGAGFPHDPERFRKFWPADVHIVGKDITRFHCVIWPAMLMAAGIEPPRGVFGHGFVYVGGGRMSKTEGRVVDPAEACAKYGADPLRYYLLREIPYDRDGDFTWENFENRYNADLANDLGNLVSRTLSMVKRYRGGVIPGAHAGASADNDRELVTAAEGLAAAVPRLVDELDFSEMLKEIWSVIQMANRYVEANAPWTLAKEQKDQRLDTVLYNLCETIRLAGVLTAPFMPVKGPEIIAQLGLPPVDKDFDFAKEMKWGRLPGGTPIGDLKVLFPKLEKK